MSRTDYGRLWEDADRKFAALKEEVSFKRSAGLAPPDGEGPKSEARLGPDVLFVFAFAVGVAFLFGTAFGVLFGAN